jgi:hypothetical protein
MMLGSRYDVEVHHVRQPRYDRRGWPDLFLLGRVAAAAREVKTGRGVLSPEQQETTRRLRVAGIDFRTWREADFEDGSAEREIAMLSGRQPWT